MAKKNMFSTDGLSGTSLAPFSPPIQVENRWNFPKGFLTKVEVREVEFKKGPKAGSKEKVLAYVFTDTEAGKGEPQLQSTLTEFPIEENDPKFDMKMEAMKKRAIHIFEVHAPLGDTPLVANAKSFEDFFEQIANAYNTRGKDGKPIYGHIPLFLKLTYYNGNLNFPMFPNFVENANGKNYPKTLVITKNDKVTTTGKGTPSANASDAFGGGGNVSSPDEFAA